ncbi:MAG TPA: sensor histidine kinase [Ktedonobacteraceae bacterium]|nr:sensor histidine kinase [Ktedonobacteraceae bacterium]
MAHSNSSVEETRQSRSTRFLKPLLSIPVFYKVLFANSFIIFVGATGGTWLASHLNDSRQAFVTPTSLAIFIALGWLVSVVLNFVVLQIAFRPLLDLGKVMSRVQKGESSLRAPMTGMDPQADQLAQTFNMVLEALDEESRQRASQIFTAQEQERKRIARELHDETSQMLTSLLISLAVLEKSVTTQEAQDRIADTRSLAHRTLRAIRNLSIDLRPSALDDLGLLPALRWYLKEYQQKCTIDVDFAPSGFKKRLSPEMEIALYRIIQEALTNIARHSNAHIVHIILHEDGQEIYASITDDGLGFDLESLPKTPGQGRGLGLAGMGERANLLNGELNINTRLGRGTTIEVRIPLPHHVPTHEAEGTFIHKSGDLSSGKSKA